MKVEREFAMESYFSKQLAKQGGMLIALRRTMQNCFQIFTTSALKTFNEAKGQEGN
jgi:hypothetical protein